MRLPLIVGCLVLSACAANPTAPAAKSGDPASAKVAQKAPAKPVLVCEDEPRRTGSIMSRRRCSAQPQAEPAQQPERVNTDGAADKAGEAGAN